MADIIDRGGPNDPQALQHVTRKRRWIHNEVAPELPPVQMREAIRIARQAGPDVRLRSAASRYNCMGMLFASRRTSIDTDLWPLIQVDDEYRQLTPSEVPQPGDVIVYRRDGNLSHLGLVLEVKTNLSDASVSATVLSQWGYSGEYVHPEGQVPTLHGVPREYWTDRRPLP